MDFLRKGTKTIGFITNQKCGKSGRKLVNVFVPTAPNPTTGFLLIMEEESVIPTTIPVEEAIKMSVSTGRICSTGVGDRILSVIEQSDTQGLGLVAVKEDELRTAATDGNAPSRGQPD